MQYDPPLIPARLVKRYKRFLADVVTEAGEAMTVHCANSGSMLGLTEAGSRVWISDSQNPKRKLRFSLELIEVGQALVGVNTHQANALAEEAINSGRIDGLTDYDSLRREVKYGENSRIDILLESDTRPPCYVEVKSVTLSRQPGLAEFPDARTTRGTKHLHEMAEQVRQGNRAVQLYLSQRNDVDRFAPASDIDPDYAQALQQAVAAGVEVIAVTCHISPEGIAVSEALPLEF